MPLVTYERAAINAFEQVRGKILEIAIDRKPLPDKSGECARLSGFEATDPYTKNASRVLAGPGFEAVHNPHDRSLTFTRGNPTYVTNLVPAIKAGLFS